MVDQTELVQRLVQENAALRLSGPVLLDINDLRGVEIESYKQEIAILRSQVQNASSVQQAEIAKVQAINTKYAEEIESLRRIIEKQKIELQSARIQSGIPSTSVPSAGGSSSSEINHARLLQQKAEERALELEVTVETLRNAQCKLEMDLKNAQNQLSAASSVSAVEKSAPSADIDVLLAKNQLLESEKQALENRLESENKKFAEAKHLMKTVIDSAKKENDDLHAQLKSAAATIDEYRRKVEMQERRILVLSSMPSGLAQPSLGSAASMASAASIPGSSHAQPSASSFTTSSTTGSPLNEAFNRLATETRTYRSPTKSLSFGSLPLSTTAVLQPSASSAPPAGGSGKRRAPPPPVPSFSSATSVSTTPTSAPFGSSLSISFSGSTGSSGSAGLPPFPGDPLSSYQQQLQALGLGTSSLAGSRRGSFSYQMNNGSNAGAGVSSVPSVLAGAATSLAHGAAALPAVSALAAKYINGSSSNPGSRRGSIDASAMSSGASGADKAVGIVPISAGLKMPPLSQSTLSQFAIL